MSNKIAKGADAALQRRVTTLETEVGQLRSQFLKLQEIIKLVAPTINVSLSKSMKTTVIQVIQWAVRRNVPKQQAVKNAVARLRERFGDEDITPEMTKYIREQAVRIYAEAEGAGWTPPEETEETDEEAVPEEAVPEDEPEQTKTAGDPV